MSETEMTICSASEDHPGLRTCEVPSLGHAKMVIAHYGFEWQPGCYWVLTHGERRAFITPVPVRDNTGKFIRMTLRASIGDGTKAWEIFSAESEPGEAARWCREQLGLNPQITP